MQRTRRTPLSGSTGTEPPAPPGADTEPENGIGTAEDLTEPADQESAGSPSSGPPSSGSPSSGDETTDAAPDAVESGSAADGGSTRRSWRMPALFGVVGLLVLALDQLTKILALRYLEPNDPVDVIGSLLRFHLIRNSGAAFSLGSDYTPVISVIQISVAAAVVWLSRRLGSTGWAAAFGLLFGGAVGNITDRIFREPSPFHGHVVDFLQLPHWAIFNVADMAVTGAAILLIVQTLRGIHLDGTRDTNPRDSNSGDGGSRDGGSAGAAAQ